MTESQASENQFRIAIDSIPTLVWIAQSDGSAEFFNMRWLDYTGLTLDEARNWGWLAAIPPTNLQVSATHGAQLLRPANRVRPKPVCGDPTESIVGFCFAPCLCAMKLERLSNGMERTPTLKIDYVLWTGCQWKALPKDLPPKSTVHDYLELLELGRDLGAHPSRAVRGRARGGGT